ncbi:MAG TPA: hypothetical protein VFU02_03680, partial [Polyangiaceae bacterium]|nr:hypothetical protein [Polyangiaceae bacterium]
MAFLACFLVHCSRCDTETAPAPSASAVALLPPTTPRGLLAEFVVPRPDTLWGVARDLVAAYAPALPREGALALVHGLGLPLAAAGLFELGSPLAGVLTRDASGQLVWTWAVQLKSGREMLAHLTTGSTPPFTVGAASSGVTGLVPSTTNARYSLAVFQNHLIVSSAPEPARDNARFVVEAARRRPVPAAGLVVTARQPQLKEQVVELLRSKWRAYQAELRESEAQARRERGRPPDFADPEAVLKLLNSAAEASFEVLATSKELTLAGSFVGSDLVLSLETLPEVTGRAQDLVKGQVIGTA